MWNSARLIIADHFIPPYKDKKIQSHAHIHLHSADEAVEFTLPGQSERVELLKMYFDKYIKTLNPGGGMFSRSQTQLKLDPEVDWDAKLGALAGKLEGFSGREIAKLAVAFQASAYGTDLATVDEALVDRVLGDRLKDHEEKKKWIVSSS
jgi:ATPase family AAA domain-containing protein 3A/B